MQDAVNRFYKATGRESSGGAALGLPAGEWETVVTGANARDALKAQNFLKQAGASVDVQVRFRGEDLIQHDILKMEILKMEFIEEKICMKMMVLSYIFFQKIK